MVLLCSRVVESILLIVLESLRCREISRSRGGAILREEERVFLSVLVVVVIQGRQKGQSLLVVVGARIVRRLKVVVLLTRRISLPGRRWL